MNISCKHGYLNKLDILLKGLAEIFETSKSKVASSDTTKEKNEF